MQRKNIWILETLNKNSTETKKKKNDMEARKLG